VFFHDGHAHGAPSFFLFHKIAVKKLAMIESKKIDLRFFRPFMGR
jgi:hypothetical protein